MQAEHDTGLDRPEITGLLQAWSEGDASARDRLMQLVYDELHRRAAICLRRERREHTLQPTALVNEAYLRLVGQRASWKNRDQFYAISAQVMRRILVDHARARHMAKRKGVRVTLNDRVSPMKAQDIDVLALDEALTKLATFDPRKREVAELRFFSGLSLDECARVLDVSIATVERDWQAAKAWLYAALK